MAAVPTAVASIAVPDVDGQMVGITVRLASSRVGLVQEVVVVRSIEATTSIEPADLRGQASTVVIQSHGIFSGPIETLGTAPGHLAFPSTTCSPKVGGDCPSWTQLDKIDLARVPGGPGPRCRGKPERSGPDALAIVKVHLEGDLVDPSEVEGAGWCVPSIASWLVADAGKIDEDRGEVRLAVPINTHGCPIPSNRHVAGVPYSRCRSENPVAITCS
mmetsp:Transcript_26941/g.40811  ORF Transcript_26941/g.40811 Transcript_26941/m.40811 type:complete len:217 (-) Transcript_26941:207-857(-)